MARYNKTSKGIDIIANAEGDKAYKLDPETELYSAVCTTAMSSKYYESEDDFVVRLRGLIGKVNPMFVAQLAVYAREEMYLRSVPMVLISELARIHSGDSLISKLTTRVIQRADEITEMLAYYQHLNSGNTKKVFGQDKKLCKLSKQIQLGVAQAFHKFDEYQFAKYNRNGEVKLRDAMFLCHPKPENKKETALYKKIATDTLSTPYTWEVELSEVGQKKYETPEAKAQAFKLKWEELIDSGKLGYMALLRNLRNILNSNVEVPYLIQVCKRLSDPEEVKKSKQLPFRFVSAYRELSSDRPQRNHYVMTLLAEREPCKSPHTPMILNALEDAILASVENLKGYDYDTSVLLACDVSGSMYQTISPKSTVSNYDIGLVLAMLLQTKCKNVITGIFGDTWKTKQMSQKAILSNLTKLYSIEGEVGYSTNGYRVLEYLIDNNIKMDRLMFFTDNQMWDSDGDSFGQYAILWSVYKKICPSAKLILFDLAGHGNTPVSIKSNDVYLISGWSDKVFDILHAIENEKEALQKIKKIKL